jgi:hypothetical protein
MINESTGEFEETRAVAYAMIERGGGFVQCLGEALCHADCENRQRIKTAFPEYWKQYGKMATEGR